LIVGLGDVVVDVVTLLDSQISYGADTVVCTSTSPGGSAANFAVWARRLGAKVGFIGRVGDDVFGDYLREDLRAEGVIASIAVGAEATGTIQILVDPTGERTMLACRGASSRLQVSDLDGDLLDRASVLHVTGYSFLEEPTRQAALTAMARVRSRGGIVSLDPSTQSVLEKVGAATFRELTRDVQILFPNLDEARVLTGESRTDVMLRSIADMYEVVALKLGADGAMGMVSGSVAVCPAPKTTAVDTTGAGDAFAAAFLVEWLGSADLPASLSAGVALASRVVQAPGARSWADGA
jgi:sugar/nucleoside kinase (ribokinase family)